MWNANLFDLEFYKFCSDKFKRRYLMKMRSTLLVATALAMGAGVMLSSPAYAVSIKPGNYTITLTGFCDVFTETLASDKITVSGTHSFSSCGYASAPADGWQASMKKTVVEPDTGAFWSLNDGAATVSESDKLATFNLDLKHNVWAVYIDVGSGLLYVRSGVLSWNYSPPSAPFAPAPATPSSNKAAVSP
jgi:hypothetical protein